MNKLISIGLLLIWSCNELHHKSSDKIKAELYKQNYSDTTKSSDQPNDNKLSVLQYGEKIIKGEIKPSDNEETFALLDSLQSDNPTTRNFALRVYQVMVISSDGFLSEAISGHIKNYFSSHPKEFIDHYKKLDNPEKKATEESVAFEFYHSGLDYKKDLYDYFENILSKCVHCTDTDKIILKEIRTSMENKIGMMVE